MKLTLRNPMLRAQAMQAIREIPLDQVFDFTLAPHKSTRSTQANARYWAMLTEISEQVHPEGKTYSPETWHEYFKARFIGKDVLILDGEPFLVAKTSTKLKVADFGDYMTQVEAWGIDHEVQFTAWEYQTGDNR